MDSPPIVGRGRGGVRNHNPPHYNTNQKVVIYILSHSWLVLCRVAKVILPVLVSNPARFTLQSCQDCWVKPPKLLSKFAEIAMHNGVTHYVIQRILFDKWELSVCKAQCPFDLHPQFRDIYRKLYFPILKVLPSFMVSLLHLAFGKLNIKLKNTMRRLQVIRHPSAFSTRIIHNHPHFNIFCTNLVTFSLFFIAFALTIRKGVCSITFQSPPTMKRDYGELQNCRRGRRRACPFTG